MGLSEQRWPCVSSLTFHSSNFHNFPFWVKNSQEGPCPPTPPHSQEVLLEGVQFSILFSRVDTLLPGSRHEELRAIMVRASCPLVRSMEKRTNDNGRRSRQSAPKD